MLIWGTGFAGIPLVLMGLTIGSLGVSRLSCERVEPTQVNCEFSRSYWLDLVQEPAVSIVQVQGVEITSEMHYSEDGDYQLYIATLLGQNRSILLFDGSTDLGQVQTIAAPVQQFLASTQPTLVWERNTIESAGASLFTVLFCIPFVLIGGGAIYSTWQTQSLILDKRANQLIYKTSTLLGNRYKRHSLGLVQGVELKQHTDSYGNQYYEPVLLPDSVRKFTLARTTNRQEALQVQNQILAFLNLPLPQGTVWIEPAWVEAATADEKLVFEGVKGNFSTTGLTTIPNPAPAELKALDGDLSKLGFTLLGDLYCSKFASLTFYVYSHPRRQTCALLIQGNLDNWRIEFFSTFTSGASLTTTTSKLPIQNLPGAKIFYRSHPGLDVTSLYQQHHQHILDLSEKWGSAMVLKEDLSVISGAIDDLLVRQTSGILLMLVAIINTTATVIASAAKSQQS